MATTPLPDVRDAVAAFKRSMADRRPALKRAFAELEDHVRREADAIRADAAAGREIVPEIDYGAIRDRRVTDAFRDAVRRTGSAVVRGVFPRAQGAAWSAELGRSLQPNSDYWHETETSGSDQTEHEGRKGGERGVE